LVSEPESWSGQRGIVRLERRYVGAVNDDGNFERELGLELRDCCFQLFAVLAVF
jgi:hypothetical protein